MKKCFIFNNLRYTEFSKVRQFNFCISKSIKDRTFFHFAIDSLSKNDRGYHIPMINLGKSKEVTAVLKL